ncbi:hypothetical protein Nmel_016090 [Mimus melanotis]
MGEHSGISPGNGGAQRDEPQEWERADEDALVIVINIAIIIVMIVLITVVITIVIKTSRGR